MPNALPFTFIKVGQAVTAGFKGKLAPLIEQALFEELRRFTTERHEGERIKDKGGGMKKEDGG
jgi:hypothetical protein